MFGKIGELNPFYGRKHTQKSKDKMSESKRLLFKDHIPKIRYKKVEHKKDKSGENNPFFGKKHSIESLAMMSLNSPKLTGNLNPKSKIVLNTERGIFYECIREASVAYNINYKYLICMLNPNTKDRNKTDLIVC